MKELVLEIAELSVERIKEKVMKTVSKISGVESVTVDTQNRKLTLKGNMDPVKVVGKLRKLCCTEIVSVGPAKKKEEPKKVGNGTTEKPENESKVTKNQNGCTCQHYPQNGCTCQNYPAYIGTPCPYYYYCTVEENPNRCVIC